MKARYEFSNLLQDDRVPGNWLLFVSESSPPGTEIGRLQPGAPFLYENKMESLEDEFASENSTEELPKISDVWLFPDGRVGFQTYTIEMPKISKLFVASSFTDNGI